MFNIFKITHAGNHKILNVLFFKIKLKSDVENYKSVKILVAYHKKAPLIKNDFIEPIHAGRSVALENSKDGKISAEEYQWMLENMMGDDTGDNISNLNRYFNEMTAIYWAWKNYDKIGNPDFFGFMHYRSIFLFSVYPADFSDSEDYMDRYGYNMLKKIISKDKNICISGYPVRFRKEGIYNEYQKWGEKLFFDKLIEIIDKKYHNIYSEFYNWTKPAWGGGGAPPGLLKTCLLWPERTFSNIVNLFSRYFLIYIRNLAIISINQK